MWWTIVIIAVIIGIIIYVKSEGEIRERATRNMIDSFQPESDEEKDDEDS